MSKKLLASLATVLICANCGSTDVREQDVEDIIQELTADIEDGEGPVRLSDSEWCYLTILTGTQEIDDPDLIPIYLEAVSRLSPYLVQFSVTSQEDNYKVWLECLESVPGHNIIKYNRGTYDVFLCTFPTNPDKASI